MLFINIYHHYFFIILLLYIYVICYAFNFYQGNHTVWFLLFHQKAFQYKHCQMYSKQTAEILEIIRIDCIVIVLLGIFIYTLLVLGLSSLIQS